MIDVKNTEKVISALSDTVKKLYDRYGFEASSNGIITLLSTLILMNCSKDNPNKKSIFDHQVLEDSISLIQEYLSYSLDEIENIISQNEKH